MSGRNKSIVIRAMYRLIVTIIIVTIFAGCAKETLVEGLSQSQASEVVAFLTKNGIPAKSLRADSSSGSGGSSSSNRYTVSVKENQYALAIVLLQENNLPRIEEPSFAETITQKGILPNSREIETLRVDRAKAAELEEAIKVIPNIEQVRAVVKSGTPPSVSLVIRKKSELSIGADQITPLVLRAIPGATVENTAVVILDALDDVKLKEIKGLKRFRDVAVSVPLVPFLGTFLVPEGDASGLSLLLFAVVILVGALSGFVGYWFGFLQKTRQQLDEEANENFLETDNFKPKRLPKDL